MTFTAEDFGSGATMWEEEFNTPIGGSWRSISAAATPRPAWVMPAAIGGGVLLLFLVMRRR